MRSDLLSSWSAYCQWFPRILVLGSVLLLGACGVAAESRYSASDGHSRHAAKVKLRREQWLFGDSDDRVTLKETSTLALVVVRCSETLDWLPSFWKEVPDNFRLSRVHVIEKCAGAKACNKASEIGKIDKALQVEASLKLHTGKPKGRVPMIPRIEVTCLKNVGMSLYGYIHHIVENYDKLEDYTFFTAGAYEKTFDLCDVPQFLELAQRRGFAGAGFHYSKGTTLGSWDPLPSCRARGPRTAITFGAAGSTLSISGNNFIASRGAVRHSSRGNYSKLVKCFETLQPKKRPTGIDDEQWHLIMPGRMENLYWEEAGHILFGMPRHLPAQDIASCKGNRSGEAARSYHAAVSVVEQEQSMLHREPPRRTFHSRVVRETHMGQYLVLGVLAYCFYNQVSAILGMASMAV